MSKKILLVLGIVLAIAAAACGQQNVNANTVTANVFAIPATGNNEPGQVTNFYGYPSVFGSTPYYYWFVSHSASAVSAVAGPLAVLGPSSLSSVNNISVSWTPVGGIVTSYDVLRTSTTVAPSGACNCAVAIGTGLTSFVDSGAALSAYTVSTLSGPWFLVNLNNGGTQAIMAEYIQPGAGVQSFQIAPPTGGGSGIPFQQNGTGIGTATTVNCFTNLTCTFNSGTVTIVASGSGGGNNLCTNNPAPGAYTLTNTAGTTDCLVKGTYTVTGVQTISANGVTILATTPGVIIQRANGASGIKFTGSQDQIIGVTLDQDAVTSTANFVEMDGNDDQARNIIVEDPGTTSSAFATFAIAGTTNRDTIDNVRFFGVQVDSCVAVNPAGSGVSSTNSPTITNVNVASFGPSAAENCIWVNQVSGSLAVDATLANDFVNVSTTNGTAFALTGQAVVQSTVMMRHHLSDLTATTSVVAARLVHIFSCNWCTLTDFVIDDGGHGSSGAALDLGDFYNSTVKGMVIKAGGGLETGIACVDCQQNTFLGNTINGVGNGDFGIFIGTASGPAEFNTIEGNTISLGFNATCFFIQANGTGDPAGFNNIVGNTCVGTDSASQLGITLTNTTGGLAHTFISGNMFEALTGTGDVGITIGSGVTGTQIADELFDSVTTHISNSGTLTTIAALDTGPVAGTLASGTATVTLPATFSAVGDATCNASDTTSPGAAINATLATTSTVTVKGTSTDAFVVSCRGF